MSADPNNPSSEKAYRQAAQRGCRVVLPAPDELQIDIDSEDSFHYFEKNLKVYDQFAGDKEGAVFPKVLRKKIGPSPSGADYHYHVTLKMDRALKGEERLLLQVCLGSDRTRELLSYVRLLRDDPQPVLFFEKDDA